MKKKRFALESQRVPDEVSDADLARIVASNDEACDGQSMTT